MGHHRQKVVPFNFTYMKFNSSTMNGKKFNFYNPGIFESLNQKTNKTTKSEGIQDFGHWNSVRPYFTETP